jgi:hypothetical protein
MVIVHFHLVESYFRAASLKTLLIALKEQVGSHFFVHHFHENRQLFLNSEMIEAVRCSKKSLLQAGSRIIAVDEN